jgi:hypothetical protein
VHLASRPDHIPTAKQILREEPMFTSPSGHEKWHLVPNSLFSFVQFEITF